MSTRHAIVAGFLCTAGALAPLNAAGARQQAVFYVSPAGNDAWSGRRDSPNADKTDGPVATVARARDLVRVLKNASGGAFKAPVTVLVADGVYTLAEPLTFSAMDSGDPGHPVTYAPAPGAHPVLSAGIPLPAWRAVTLEGKQLWAAPVPKASGADPDKSRRAFRELYVNNQRRTLARSPDRGYLHLQDIPDLPAGTQWTSGKNYFRFAAADAPAWKNAAGADAVVFTRWIDNHLTVAGVDLEKRTATFTRRSVFLLNAGDLYFLEGAAPYLDAPGEWYFNSTSGTVYYLPLPDERIDGSPAVVPNLPAAVEIKGQPDQGRFVEHLRFQGLTFSHAQWWFPADRTVGWTAPDVMGFVQAAWGVPGAVRAQGARHVAFENCTISHVGGYALELASGCTDNTVSRCTLTDLGAGGIKIGQTTLPEKPDQTTARNTVEDCTITDGGHMQHQAIGLWIGQSPDNRIAHNRISEFDYSGISIGWTWGYGAAQAGGNIVEFNEIDHLGDRPGNTEPPLGDMAGIYTLGTQAGTIIRNNYFHDIAGHSIAWGIYFDEGSTGILAENNLVLRTTHGGFHQHYGKDNIVRNNIFGFGRDAQVWRSRAEEHTSFTLAKNIVISDNGQWFSGDWSRTIVLENNLYWRTGAQPVPFPGGKDLAGWLAMGLDKGSIVADPKLDLTNPKRPILAADSPARGLGFVPFDLSTVGPRPKAP